MVSVLPCLLMSGLSEPRESCVIWRRRECMLRCFFRARTGETVWLSVPRLRCEGSGGCVGRGVNGEGPNAGDLLNSARIFGVLDGVRGTEAGECISTV